MPLYSFCKLMPFAPEYKGVTKQSLGEVSELAVRIKNIPIVILSMLCHQAFKYSGKRKVTHHILNYRKKKKILIPEMRCDKKEESSDLADSRNQRNS